MVTHDKICEAVASLAEKYSIKTASYFGSYAAGLQTEGSDIDLLVEFQNPFVSLFTTSRLTIELEDKLKTPIDLIGLPLPTDTHLVIDKKVKCYG